MDKFVLDVYAAANSQDNVFPKALANFLFRQVIENVHSKYGISQEDMKQMSKDAVNRAAVFLQIQKNDRLYNAFSIEAIDCTEWDEPETTDILKERMELYESLSKEINLK